MGTQRKLHVINKLFWFIISRNTIIIYPYKAETKEYQEYHLYD